MKKHLFQKVIVFFLFLVLLSCNKDNVSADSLYVPSETDVTANATLAELQQGRTIYINKCGSCHGLYSPDSYSSSRWKSIMVDMAAKANLSSGDASLTLKYVTRGK
jgi:cytochrome c5